MIDLEAGCMNCDWIRKVGDLWARAESVGPLMLLEMAESHAKICGHSIYLASVKLDAGGVLGYE